MIIISIRAVQSAMLRGAREPRVVLTLVALLLAVQVTPWWVPGPDASAYLSIARSIAQGGPITAFGSPKLHYSPGYAFLISPAFLLGDRPLLALAIEQWLLAVVFMWGLYQWTRRWLPTAALWATALVMLNANFWLYERMTISETAFMALLVWSANLLDRLLEAGEARRAGLLTAAASVVIAAMSLVRPVGILIVAGYGVASFMAAYTQRCSWRRTVLTTFALGVPGTAAILGVLMRETQMAAVVGSHERTYFDEFLDPRFSLAEQLVEGARLRVSEAGRLLFPGMLKAYAENGQWFNINMMLYLPLGAGLVWAWSTIARRGRNVLAMLAPFYIALYVLYPFDQGTRYLLPLLPLGAICVWQFFNLVPKYRLQCAGVLLALHMAATGVYSVKETRRAARAAEWWPAVDAVAATLDGRPGFVVTRGLPDGVKEMLKVASDRPVEAIAAHEIPPKEYDWLLVSDAEVGDSGYVVVLRAGSCTLLHRADQQALGEFPTRK